MSNEGVKQVIGTLISNPTFQKAFFANPRRTLKNSGYALTPTEIRALIRIKKKDIDVKIMKRGKIMKIIGPRILPPPPQKLKTPKIQY